MVENVQYVVVMQEWYESVSMPKLVVAIVLFTVGSAMDA